MSAPIIQAAVVAANKAAGIKFTGPLLWKVTYRRCAAHSAPNVQASAQVLGLRKLNHTVIVKNVRPVRGLLHVVRQIHQIRKKKILPFKSLLNFFSRLERS
jgi:ribosomal protein L30/L7E